MRTGPHRAPESLQYDPSNAIVAGDDPVALLECVADRARDFPARTVTRRIDRLNRIYQKLRLDFLPQVLIVLALTVLL